MLSSKRQTLSCLTCSKNHSNGSTLTSELTNWLQATLLLGYVRRSNSHKTHLAYLYNSISRQPHRCTHSSCVVILARTPNDCSLKHKSPILLIRLISLSASSWFSPPQSACLACTDQSSSPSPHFTLIFRLHHHHIRHPTLLHSPTPGSTTYLSINRSHQRMLISQTIEL